MAIGFALLSISPLHEKTVFDSLNNVSEIIEIHPLFGEYDILVKIQTADIDAIGEVVIKKNFRPALKELEKFSHVNVVWWANQNDTPESRKTLHVDSKKVLIKNPGEFTRSYT